MFSNAHITKINKINQFSTPDLSANADFEVSVAVYVAV